MAAGGGDEEIVQRILRFTDVAQEPTDFLMPISGYEKMPIVSLEEAVKPLVSLLPAIKSYAYAAKRKCEKPVDNLTQDESASIMLYSMGWKPLDECLYFALNATLRSADRDKLKPWFLYLRLFLAALFRLPPMPLLTVFRGVKQDLSPQFKKSKIIVWWGFSSCTTSIQVLQSEQFLGKSGTRTMFTIQCHSARNIRNHSYYPAEDEVLLLAATEFKVNGVLDQGHDLYNIHLQEIQSAEPLLIPVPLTADSKNLVSNQLANVKVSKNTTGSNVETIQLVTKTPNSSTTQEISVSMHISQESDYPLRSPSSTNIHPNAQWQKDGITVAGGNGKGSEINQLCNPRGLYVDDAQTVYVADESNHRIVEWKWGATSGQVVAGGNGQGNGAHQLSYPTDVIIDKERDSLIICDYSNRRVVQWPRRNGTRGETIISNIDCMGLTMDKNGSLYISDFSKHEVRRYRRGESQGTLLAGGNGSGNHLNQLSYPRYVLVDRDHSVYVSDCGNHRVMKWMEDTKQCIIVAGGQGNGNGLTQVSYPKGVVVDQLGTVYVADYGTDRIMRWTKAAKQGSVIAGGNGRGKEMTQLNEPFGLSFDRHGNLYVVDSSNHRVQKFNLLENK
ncbi:unnamed protein product [Rotaria sp. Silwood2]|nr:unnamed protein product [Rotaria sp. Silwood2]